MEEILSLLTSPSTVWALRPCSSFSLLSLSLVFSSTSSSTAGTNPSDHRLYCPVSRSIKWAAAAAAAVLLRRPKMPGVILTEGYSFSGNPSLRPIRYPNSLGFPALIGPFFSLINAKSWPFFGFSAKLGGKKFIFLCFTCLCRKFSQLLLNSGTFFTVLFPVCWLKKTAPGGV